jgi:transcriptional regulator with XRE-family HTH domain
MTHSQIDRKTRSDCDGLRPPPSLCEYAYMAKQRHFIREWRKHRGLTQAQLAERIGIAESYVSKIESGKRRYDQPFLEAAADVLRCDPADLIIRDPSDPDGIWTVWDTIPVTKRAQALALLKVIQGSGTGTDG